VLASFSPGPTVAHSADETDESLIARLGQADEGALRELHRRYASLVFTIAARLVGGTAAEEVVQDVFMTLWRKSASFDPARGSFRPWIVQVARRHALNGLRHTKGAASGDDGTLEHIQDEAVAPDEARWLIHRQAAIRAAVDALPETQRRALSLAFFDELTHEQIAKVLGTRVGTTKTRIRLALKRLAPALLAVAAAGAAVILVWRREERTTRDEEALKMVTSSDVLALRLAATSLAPPEAHGTYRARSGARVAVLTTSHLPALTGADTYVAWVRRGEVWRRLGSSEVESDGRSVLVSAIEPEGSRPDEVRVTREASADGVAPHGPAVLVWSAEAAPPR
jgi:RNA polymerase sigma-70 factor (ECF subfamily)